MSKKSIINPDCLVHGDGIGIVAPSSPFDEKKFAEGIKIIEAMGFKVNVPADILDPMGYLSAEDTVRAGQLNRYFADNSIKAIMCARGGYGSIRLLPYLDLDLIRENPKIFIGYSDVTVLLTAFYRNCNLAVFHGPMVAGLSEIDEISLDSLQKALTSFDSLEYLLDECSVLKFGKANGSLVGGNLTSLCHLVGTPYGMNCHGRILFLEDRGEALYRIDRMLMHFKLAGCFDGIKGLILGSFIDCGDYTDIVRVVGEIIKDLDIPIICGFGAGHGNTNLTLPLGLPVLLDTDRRILKFNP